MAKWVYDYVDRDGLHRYGCSACKYILATRYIEDYNYCPYCGSFMKDTPRPVMPDIKGGQNESD